MSGKITALQVQKKNKERVNVFIEGEFAFGITLNEALQLKKGQYLSDQEIASLLEADQGNKAYDSALHYLSFRARSEEEVRRNLAQKGFPDEAVDAALSRLKDVGLLDDLEFARLWVSSREQISPRGKRALRYELHQKGIADHQIDEILDLYDEEKAAYEAIIERLSRFSEDDKATYQKKMGAFLQRRGFTYPVIRDALEEAWQKVLDSNEEYR